MGEKGREEKREGEEKKEICWKAWGRKKDYEYLKVNKSFPVCSASGPFCVCVCVCFIYMEKEEN